MEMWWRKAGMAGASILTQTLTCGSFTCLPALLCSEDTGAALMLNICLEGGYVEEVNRIKNSKPI